MAKPGGETTEHYAWLGKLIAEDRNSEESTCDLVLESGGKKFPVHKNIMMLVSKYFKKMFTIEMKEKYEGIVKMLQIPHQRLANLIEFIYSGRIEITEKNVTDILDDAEYTELEALKEICKTALHALVSADNCLKLRAYAERYNLDEVFVETNQKITTCFAQVVQQEEFLQLDADDVSAVTKLRNKGCEEAVFTGILKWVNHNPLQREEFFANLFLQIDLSLTSTQFLTEASKESLVRNNVVCSNYLVDNLLKTRLDSPTGGEISSSVQDSDLPTYSSFASPSQPNPVLSPKYLQHAPTSSHSACSYTDKLLIVGGQESSDDCIVYDVITKQKTYLPNLNHGRSDATSVKVGRKVYVVGGYDDYPVETCEMLDLNEPTRWSFMSNMLTARGSCSSCYFKNHIYVTGGWNSGRLSSCERFSVHHNMWIKIENMINARDEHGTVVCNGFLYSIGGSQRSKRLSSCERYDMRSGVWNEIAPLNQARKGLTCVELDGNIYAIGGNGGGTTVERFNPTIGRWANVASLQYARYLTSACVVGNKIFVVGGSSGEESRNSVQVYDSTADVWTTAFKTQKPVCEATVVAI